MCVYLARTDMHWRISGNSHTQTSRCFGVRTCVVDTGTPNNVAPSIAAIVPTLAAVPVARVIKVMLIPMVSIMDHPPNRVPVAIDPWAAKRTQSGGV